jgi:hypothetical protein
MSIKDDLIRAYGYGGDAYYNAIIEVPSYQAELSRVRTDYNEQTWIDFAGFWPKFTSADFKAMRERYQAKYGTAINIPGFADVIHITPQATISPEERAAHIFAKKRGLPSPLTPAQVQALTIKKYRFLRALATPTPDWMQTYGAVATTLDNIEDALVTIAVLGKIAVRISPALFRKAIPGLGWLLLGSDILNLANIFSWSSFSAMSGKRSIEALAEKNPFHAKAKARRTLKLNRTIPTFGEILEILQTTDQLFGVGLCLGGLVGLVTDAASTAFSPKYWEQFGTLLRNANADEISSWLAGAAANDYNSIKKALQQQWKEFKDEAYRLKEEDKAIRNAVYNWAQKKRDQTWDWIKSIPPETLDPFGAGLVGALIMSTGQDTYSYEDHTNAYIMLDTEIKGLIPWWTENDPLANFSELRRFKFRAPHPKDETTIDMLNEFSPTWQTTVKWPHLGTKYATIEEIALTYAPKIKDSFQAYAIRHSKEYGAMVAGQQIVEFTKNIIRAFSDDNEAIVGMTAYWYVSEAMMREIYVIPPDTTETTITALADYIGNYERQAATPPSIKEVSQFGESIGIEWIRTFPRRAYDQAADIFPEWQQIQDQIEDIYIPE